MRNKTEVNKMKCHKIRGIDLKTCTAEQKIAYNYAFMWVDCGKKIFNSNSPESVKSEELQDIVQSIIRNIKQNGTDRTHNIDAIITAFRNGFRGYCKNFFIASDYESIGKAFPILYELEV